MIKALVWKEPFCWHLPTSCLFTPKPERAEPQSPVCLGGKPRGGGCRININMSNSDIPTDIHHHRQHGVRPPLLVLHAYITRPWQCYMLILYAHGSVVGLTGRDLSPLLEWHLHPREQSLGILSLQHCGAHETLEE